MLIHWNGFTVLNTFGPPPIDHTTHENSSLPKTQSRWCDSYNWSLWFPSLHWGRSYNPKPMARPQNKHLYGRMASETISEIFCFVKTKLTCHNQASQEAVLLMLQKFSVDSSSVFRVFVGFAHTGPYHHGWPIGSHPASAESLRLVLWCMGLRS
jgi:hypothetical protein